MIGLRCSSHILMLALHGAERNVNQALNLNRMYTTWFLEVVKVNRKKDGALNARPILSCLCKIVDENDESKTYTSYCI